MRFACFTSIEAKEHLVLTVRYRFPSKTTNLKAKILSENDKDRYQCKS